MLYAYVNFSFQDFVQLNLGKYCFGFIKKKCLLEHFNSCCIFLLVLLTKLEHSLDLRTFQKPILRSGPLCVPRINNFLLATFLSVHIVQARLQNLRTKWAHQTSIVYLILLYNTPIV